MKGTSIFVIILLCQLNVFSQEIKFNLDVEEINPDLCEFVFTNHTTDSRLSRLRDEYQLKSLIQNKDNKIEHALSLLDWAHHRWKHNGYNIPSKNDVFTILEEAKEGNDFRCVEYGIVLSESLKSIGIPSRIIGLKTSDVETRESGAGHLATEFYDFELGKWIFADPQFNYVAVLDGKYLNTVEFQKAILTNRDSLKLINKDGELNVEDQNNIIKWIFEYLYFISSPFDNTGNAQKCNGELDLMLVPIGANKPKVFQKKWGIGSVLYTNNYHDFYKRPTIIAD